MNDKERLEHIKSKIRDLLLLGDSEGYGEVNINAIYNDMSWLIEQAEKVEQLEQSLNDAAEMAEQFLNDKYFYMDELKKAEQQLQQAKAEVRKYENALREIDTHIRSTSEPVPYIIQTLIATLPEYK